LLTWTIPSINNPEVRHIVHEKLSADLSKWFREALDIEYWKESDYEFHKLRILQSFYRSIDYHVLLWRGDIPPEQKAEHPEAYNYFHGKKWDLWLKKYVEKFNVDMQKYLKMEKQQARYAKVRRGDL